jgi:primosomal protein N' (replication factor Y)
MYQAEIEKRKQFFYPPFSRLIHLTFRHKEREVVKLAAEQFAQSLEPLFANYIVGPAEPVVNRVRNMFLMEMLLKLPRDAQLITACKQRILKQCAVLHSDKKFAKVIVVPDVDAM